MGEVVSTSVSGMTCMSCVGRVKEALESLEGSYNIDVQLETGSVNLQGISLEEAEQAIISLGYKIGTPTTINPEDDFNWRDGTVWGKSAYNTMWCLIGCSIGDLGTIYYFQNIEHSWPVWGVMTLAIINGLLTSIALETVILLKQFPFQDALRTAMGMSLISMIAMEAAMNITDVVLTGGAMLTPEVIIPMWIAGFLTPWPYNYWRLKKYGISCH